MATAAAVAIVGSTFAITSPATAGPGSLAPASDRLSGADRFATAADVALDPAWSQTGLQPTTVVNGNNYPDGLAAAPLGNRILLVEQNSIPAATASALTAIEAFTSGSLGDINVIGGSGVISSTVVNQLDALNGANTVTRLSGADRYATALDVADAVDGIDDIPSNVVLATGTSFPDALAAGPLAINLTDTPIVLTQGAALRADVKAYLLKTSGTIYIVGGEGAVPASIVTELLAAGKTVERISGATREATAVAISERMAALELGGDPSADNGKNSAVNVFRGGFADALAAGPFAALDSVDGSIMLVGTNSPSTPTANWHANNCTTIGATAASDATPAGVHTGVYAIGGTGVISDAVVTAAVGAATCQAVQVTSATFATSDAKDQVRTITQIASLGPVTDVFGGNGPTLTAVAGSAAGGPGTGNDWTVNFLEAAPTAAPSPLISVSSASTTVTLTYDNGEIDGLTQAEFVADWNGSAAASALFTAAPTIAAVKPTFAAFNADDAAVGGINIAQVAGTADYEVVVTFNQPVDSGAAVSAVPAKSEFTFDDAGNVNTTLATMNPVGGTASPTGTTVFTLSYNDSALAPFTTVSDVVIAGVFSVGNGLQIAAPNNDVSLTAA